MRSSRSLVAFLAHGSLLDIGSGSVFSGDARTFCADGFVEPGSADVVITSPPYATALPYLDTDRLSLIYFDLLPRSEHRSHDHFMIGNREVTERGRKSLWEYYESQRNLLPHTVTDLIDQVEEENNRAAVGFRRKNLGALLGKYFCDMRKVLQETNECLRPGAPAFFVVGNNRTTLPSGELEIETAFLLLDIAKSLGFENCRSDAMEMLSSRDLFSKNQTPSEHILRMVRQK